MAIKSKVIAAALIAGSSLACAEAAADGPVIITQATALAGNVTPGDPAGFPVLITESGSYRLGSDLKVPKGRSGIVISASSVTVDLDGFALNGQGVAIHGILASSEQQQTLTVHNGRISEFTGSGIHAHGVSFGAYERLRVHWNGGIGVLTHHYSTIMDSVISKNGGAGVDCQYNCLIKDNVISMNKREGIIIGQGSIVGNVITYNYGSSIKAWTYAGTAHNVIDGITTGDIIPMMPNASPGGPPPG